MCHRKVLYENSVQLQTDGSDGSSSESSVWTTLLGSWVFGSYQYSPKPAQMDSWVDFLSPYILNVLFPAARWCRSGPQATRRAHKTFRFRETKEKNAKKNKKLQSVCAAEHPHKSSLIPHDVVFIWFWPGCNYSAWNESCVRTSTHTFSVALSSWAERNPSTFFLSLYRRRVFVFNLCLLHFLGLETFYYPCEVLL